MNAKQRTQGKAVKERNAVQGRPSGRYSTACTGCGINQHHDKKGEGGTLVGETGREKKKRDKTAQGKNERLNR